MGHVEHSHSMQKPIEEQACSTAVLLFISYSSIVSRKRFNVQSRIREGVINIKILKDMLISKEFDIHRTMLPKLWVISPSLPGMAAAKRIYIYLTLSMIKI